MRIESMMMMVVLCVIKLYDTAHNIISLVTALRDNSKLGEFKLFPSPNSTIRRFVFHNQATSLFVQFDLENLREKYLMQGKYLGVLLWVCGWW